MAEEEDGRFIAPDEDGADENFKVVHHVFPVGWVSLDAKERRGERGRRRRRIEGKF